MDQIEVKIGTLADAAAGADGAGELWGYANVKGVVDSYGDVVADGAYAELEALQAMGFGALGHDWYGLPIGTIEEAKEDEKGLWFRMAFHSTKAAQDVRTVVDERLARGKDVGLSIGYMATDYEWQKQGDLDVRVLNKIKVFEVSVVSVPANAASLVEGVKGAARGLTLDDQMEAALAAVESATARIEALKELREGDHRHLPERRSAQAKELLARFGSLASALEPAKTTPRLDDARLLLEAADALYRRLAS